MPPALGALHTFLILMHHFWLLLRLKPSLHSQRPNSGSGLKFLTVLQVHCPVLLMARL